MTTKFQFNRRNFLRFGTGATLSAASLANPASVFATTPANRPGDRILRFHNTHTRQKLDLVYWTDNGYHENNLMRLNYLLRDHRQNEAIIMDRKLFDQLWTLQQALGGDGVYNVISGYRSPKTNAMLRRKRSGGVARNSFHMQGRAIDIQLTGTSVRKLHRAAISMKAGGVGFYPNSNFVHLDTGRVRDWQSS